MSHLPEDVPVTPVGIFDRSISIVGLMTLRSKKTFTEGDRRS
jgi:hypothetical protein